MGPAKAIFVQGCARSGNTLMRELCASGFRHAQLVKISNEVRECSLSYLVESLELQNKKTVVSFLRWVELFSSSPKKTPLLLVASRDREASLSMDLDLLRANPEIKVIWMLRDPLDVLTSIHAGFPGEFYVKPERLVKSLELYQRFKNEKQVLTVRYEELVLNSGDVQSKVANTFQLEPIRDFSEGHKHFTQDEQIRAMHAIRPIDAKSVAKWKSNPAYKEYLQKVVAGYPMLISLSRDCGYEINLA